MAGSQPGSRSIALAEGLTIQGVPAPAAFTEDAVPGTTMLVADRDLAELADILGAGSRVIIRQ